MTDYEKVEKVIRYLQLHHREQPNLQQLAEMAGLSDSHFQRLFSKWAGTSPKSFLQYLTAQNAKRLLQESRSVLNAALECGLSGPGRLHDLMIHVEAMSPGEWKLQGEGIEICFGIHETPFGECLIACTKRGVTHLSFSSERRSAILELERRWPRARIVEDRSATKIFIEKIFGDSQKRTVSLHLKGTPFQIKVWEALLRIPAGELRTYSDIAKSIGSPKASRAVGTAIGSNEIAYLIPCHRVIRETGDFGQYRWDSIRKRAMIGWEIARKENFKR